MLASRTVEFWCMFKTSLLFSSSAPSRPAPLPADINHFFVTQPESPVKFGTTVLRLYFKPNRICVRVCRIFVPFLFSFVFFNLFTMRAYYPNAAHLTEGPTSGKGATLYVKNCNLGASYLLETSEGTISFFPPSSDPFSVIHNSNHL